MSHNLGLGAGILSKEKGEVVIVQTTETVYHICS